MEFKKRLKIRLQTAIFYVVIGIILILANIVKHDEMMSTFGILFLVMGIARIVQYKRITKDEESIRRQEIIETDERNIALWTNARSQTFTVYIMLAAISIVVFYILKMYYIAKIIGLMLSAFILIYWICYYIISKRY